MGRINLKQLEKVEELPERIGARKFIKAYAEKKDRDNYRMSYHGEKHYGVIKRIIRGSIGKNWDKVIEHIKTKVPENYYNSIIDWPERIEYDVSTNLWYIKDRRGGFSWRGYKTASEAKKSGGRWSHYYIDKQNVLKKFSDPKKEFTIPITKQDRQIQKKYEKIAQYLKSIAKFSVKAECYWYRGSVYYVRFDHPVLKEQIRVKQEDGSYIDVDTDKPKKIELNIDQFITYCTENNYSYIIKRQDKYITNMKWSL